MLTLTQCDQPGHFSRECTEAKDWGKVKCRHCGEMGHASEKRCDPEKQAAYAAAHAAAGNDAIGDTNDFSNAGAAGGDDGWAHSGNNFRGSGQADWETDGAPSAPAITIGSGGGGW